MSTIGTAYFKIKESENSEPVRVGVMGISRDAYPSGYGYKVCEIITGIRVDDSENIPLGEQAKCKCFRNTEHVILHILNILTPDYYFHGDVEYEYHFIFSTHGKKSSYYISDAVTVEVKCLFGDKYGFCGTFDEFRKYCDCPDK